MSNLRNKLIRLAHAKPELRKDLLPLLKEAKGSEKYRADDVDVAEEMQAACDKAGLKCKVKDEKMFGSMIPHIEIFGEKSEIEKVVKKFKDVSKKVANMNMNPMLKEAAEIRITDLATGSTIEVDADEMLYTTDVTNGRIKLIELKAKDMVGYLKKKRLGPPFAAYTDKIDAMRDTKMRMAKTKK